MSNDVVETDIAEWAEGLAEVAELIGGRFARVEPRANAMAYLRRLLSGVERKNFWTLSEQAGQKTPDAMQRLLSTTDWDPDARRDDLRAYVVSTIGDRAGCWWWTRPGSSRRAPARPGWPASTRAVPCDVRGPLVCRK